MRRVALSFCAVVLAALAAAPALGESIGGTVVSPDGKPVAGADVVLTQDDNDEAWPNNPPKHRAKSNVSTKTDADGRFTVARADGAAPYAVGIVHDAGYADLHEESFPADGAVTLRPWGRIEGTVTRSGKPAANAPVRVWNFRTFGRPLVTFDYTVRTDKDGRFDVKRALPDFVAVMDEGGKGRNSSLSMRYVEVEAGKTSRVDLGGSPGARVVVGRVGPGTLEKLPSGKDVFQSCSLKRKLPAPPNFPMDNTTPQSYFRRFEAEAAWRRTDEGRAYYRDFIEFGIKIEPDGSFRIEDVPPGEHELDVRLQPIGANRTIGQPILQLKRTVTIPAGPAAEPVDLGMLEPDKVENPGL